MTNQHERASSRLHYLDALRAFVMSIGVVLHASVVGFNSFSVKVGFFSGLFRMKLFTLIAGFFVALLISRRGLKATIIERFVRFGIPAIVATVLINPVANYFLYYNSTSKISVYEFVSHPLTWNKAGFAWGSVTPIYMSWHLQVWFLYVSLILVSFTSLLLKIQKSQFIGRLSRLVFIRNDASLRAWLIGIAMGGAFATGRVAHFLTTQQLLGDSPLNYLAMNVWLYLPYFGLGLIAFHNEKVMDALHNTSPVPILMSIGVYALSAQLYIPTLKHYGLGAAELLEYIGKGYLGFYVCVVFLALFKIFANRHNRIAEYLSSASYSVYIFHVLAVAFVQYIFLRANTPRDTVYWVSIPVAYVLCLVAHQLLVRSNAIGELIFNGKLPIGRAVRASNSKRSAV